LGGFESLSDIPGLSELHTNYLLLVVHVLALSAAYFEVDQVVEYLADLEYVDIWTVYLDL
jgi:hypothetical protein